MIAMRARRTREFLLESAARGLYRSNRQSWARADHSESEILTPPGSSDMSRFSAIVTRIPIDGMDGALLTEG